jgi:hypothetical protein
MRLGVESHRDSDANAQIQGDYGSTSWARQTTHKADSDASNAEGRQNRYISIYRMIADA